MVSQDNITDLLILVLGTSSMLIMVIAIITFAFLFQKKLNAKQKAYREIEILLQEQEINSAYSIIQNQEEERKRVAGEVHDNIGNLIATLKIYSDLILLKKLEPEVKELSNKLNNIIYILSEEVRKISFSLDSSVVQRFGLKASIEQLCDRIHSSGMLIVELIFQKNIELKPENSIHLYRIIQELLTNTLKHANASNIKLEIIRTVNIIIVEYSDDGIGFNSEKLSKISSGRSNINSRINYLKGNITCKSSESGTKYIIKIPKI